MGDPDAGGAPCSPPLEDLSAGWRHRGDQRLHLQAVVGQLPENYYVVDARFVERQIGEGLQNAIICAAQVGAVGSRGDIDVVRGVAETDVVEPGFAACLEKIDVAGVW